MTKLTPAFIAQFKKARAHQMATFSESNSWTRLEDGRLVRDPAGSGGGAAPGWHATAAFLSAKRHFHFVARLSAQVAEDKRRSKAAKKGWATRRARENA